MTPIPVMSFQNFSGYEILLFTPEVISTILEAYST